MAEASRQIQLFATCPQSKDVPAESYRRQVIEVAQWSEDAGCTGILVYTDNGIIDPWHVAQVIIEHTRHLAPLVAVQPIYMHPYAVAKKISTLAFLYDRRVWIHMVSGGFTNDLHALDDETPHDDRYLRLVEYSTIISQLLRSPEAVTYEGKYYRVKNLKLTPPLPPKLFPGITSSGSSDAGMQAAADIGAVAVRYPRPPDEEQGLAERCAAKLGVRVGIIARDTADAAWDTALRRFPEDRRGQLLHQLAMKTSDSQWHHQLSMDPPARTTGRATYWLQPFHNYKTFCPYLVGDHDQVAELISSYVRAGFLTFILDIPPSPEELAHTRKVFDRAQVLAAGA
jgi:alkanesulfonate monooxygenase